MLAPTDATITSELVDALNPALLRAALRMVGRRADAEDLVQDTWFSALRTAHTYEARSSFRTWLTGIMRRRHIDRFRKERPSEAYEDERCAGPSEEPSRWIDARAAARIAGSAGEPLTQLELTAVRLCDLEELERAEAARRLGISRGHLRVVLHRARHKLERTLSAHGFQH
ncbi:MAG: RNA polymerase sigma factor [Polyangiales bacterium]